MTVNEMLKMDPATIADREIESKTYGIMYFEFSHTPTSEEWDNLSTLRARCREIEAKKKAAIKARAAGREQVKLASCGHYTTEIMMSSRGTCCPACYDRMSD